MNITLRLFKTTLRWFNMKAKLPLLFCFCALIGTLNANPDSLRRHWTSYAWQASPVATDTAYFLLSEQLAMAYNSAFELDSAASTAHIALQRLDNWLQKNSDQTLRKRLDYYRIKLHLQHGNALMRNGDYAGALPSFQQAQTSAERSGATARLPDVFVAIARCHQNLEDYERAREYAEKARQTLRLYPNNNTMARVLVVLADYHGHVTERTDSAIIYTKEALRLLELENNEQQITRITFSLLEFFQYEFMADSCLEYLEKIRPIIERNPSPDQWLRYQVSMGHALFEKRRYRESLEYLSAARQAVETDGTPLVIAQVCKYYCLALAAADQPIEALKNMETALAAYGEDINTDKARALNSAQLNFEFEQKTAAARLELERQKRIRDLSIGGLAAGLMLAFLLYRLYRQSKRSAAQLKQKNAEIEKAYQDLQATQTQLVLTEKQREAQSVRVRIARDIHDELGAGLTKITMMSDVLRRKIGAEQADISRILQQIIENSKGVSASLSEIVWAVNPTHDSLDSLSSYLKNYTAHYLEGSGIEVEFDFPEQPANHPIEPELKRSIFLVLKESLNNAVKYAQANKIKVAFHTDDAGFSLQIQDNGVGFLPGEVSPDGGGNGLINLKTRMEHLGCRYQISSAPGQGCSVKAEGPLVSNI